MDFADNQEVVETLAQKPLNCFALMDEESRFPQVRKRYFFKLNELIKHFPSLVVLLQH